MAALPNRALRTLSELISTIPSKRSRGTRKRLTSVPKPASGGACISVILSGDEKENSPVFVRSCGCSPAECRSRHHDPEKNYGV